jgi:hypothetical protein
MCVCVFVCCLFVLFVCVCVCPPPLRQPHAIHLHDRAENCVFTHSGSSSRTGFGVAYSGPLRGAMSLYAPCVPYSGTLCGATSLYPTSSALVCPSALSYSGLCVCVCVCVCVCQRVVIYEAGSMNVLLAVAATRNWRHINSGFYHCKSHINAARIHSVSCMRTWAVLSESTML